MNYKLLGLIGLIGAPALGLGTYLSSLHHPIASNWFAKLWGLLYISSWIASLEGLRRMEATGSNRFGKTLIRLTLVTLMLANVYNVWELINPKSTSPLYFLVDMCWPLSHILMTPIGVAVLRARRVQGWLRWVPLAMGFWFPLTMLLSIAYGITSPAMALASLYSAVTWSLLAVLVMVAPVKKRQPFLATVS